MALSEFAGGIEAPSLEHKVGADQSRADNREQFAVERVVREHAWPLSGKALGESDPGITQPVDFERGEIVVTGAQIADCDPVVGARRFDCRVEIGKIIGQSQPNAAQQG